ncbi:AraC family transcriptional regulator [Halomonas sp. MCCC 1A11036]|uniref:AraC family transcriptional regulator n=1 Tax=Billgrantia zhangzhouensis TaxID=2733481 RepID=A0ABS9AHB1_9GAMM|nr:AraC family transcriptional regulator [Halomonas zhangzhouensis]MCE8021137.1 AraC family transcriptional regulator [Halomonas zhangzhouensis]
MSLLDLRACNLGREHIAHEHAHHQLILATCGSTELEVAGLGDRVTGGRGCLIPCSFHHEYEGDGRNRTLVLDVPLAAVTEMCDGEGLQRLFERPRFFTVPARLSQLATALMAQLEQFPALHSEIAALLLRAIYLHLEGEASTPVLASRRRSQERIDIGRLDAWIDRHLAEEIRVERLAALCALSPGHFHALFRELMGITPLAYVQQRRLEHARTLVRHSDLSLGHIAALVGFRDQGSFSRAYRRHFDGTPSQERRHAEAAAESGASLHELRASIAPSHVLV